MSSVHSGSIRPSHSGSIVRYKRGMVSLHLTRSPNHFNLSDLPEYPGSKVILSRLAAKAAVVFVHGFRGDALQTWKGFDDLATQDPAFAATDLYFFGYDGFKSNTLAATSFLFQLLAKLGTTPQDLLRPLLSPNDQSRQQAYERIVLVAHSLGAVVSRWALAHAVEEGALWRNNVRLILFAPAHCGSELKQVATAAASGFPWLQALTQGLSVAVPLVTELAPGSPILKELEARITKHLANGEASIKAACVVIAEHEIVVSNLPFVGDPFPYALRDTDHVSLCKPTLTRKEPLRYVAELLA